MNPLPSDFQGGLIFVHAAIGDGPPGLFLLDTGAAVTVLDARFAQAAKVPQGYPRVLLRGGGGGVLTARQAENIALTLAGKPPLMVDPIVADLSAVGQRMRLPLDGILGDDILTRFVVTLDYQGHQVRLSSPEDAPPPPADAALMRLISTPFVMASARMGARQAATWFQIDTGSNTAVEFYAPFARLAFPDAATTPDKAMGLAGRTGTALGWIDGLQTAGRQLGQLYANFAGVNAPDDAPPGYGGVIGGPAWAGLVLTLDFPHRRAWVR